ncbi:MAG TPA: glutamate 5-kinase, partial [Planctomycetaceae bacterium]|nr:glutamate 5-kinase [Planctomycetaceae bacterium]
KRWIAFSAQPQGSLGIDAGAAQALQREGRSLLAIGIRNVTGNFRKGDVVVIYNPEGQEIARGLTNYSTTDLQKIKGRQSREIADLLGHCPYDEVVHRDNLNLASSP